MAKVEGPLRLKDDFAIFTFAEYESSRPVGRSSSCDGTI